MMKKDITVYVNSKTSMVDLHISRLGITGENLQGNLIVKFDDEFVNGTAILEIQRNNEKYYLVMQKENESYYLPILSSLLSETTTIIMQIRITEGTDDESIPVWKSNKFYLKVEEAINAEIPIPEEYDEWIDIANAKLNELDTEKNVKIYDGEKGDTGANGLDAKINGVNTLTIEAGTNITLDQEGNILTINSTASGGTSDYTDLTNKPKINNVELAGNKSLNDLGIQPAGNYALESEIPDVSSFITKDVNNLTYYTLKTNTGSLIDLEMNDTTYVVTLKLKNQDGTIISTDTIDLPLESVVVSGRYDNTTKKVILTLENGSEVDFSVADLVAGLQTEITSQNKLASDLVNDTNSGNKFVTTSEKQTWNNKYDKPNGGIPKTDLASDVQTSLGKADTAIQSSDLTNYVTNTDYATAEKGGTIRTSNASGLGISNGNLYAVTKAYNTYSSASGNMFIGKGTLENVITGKNLVSNTDYGNSSTAGVFRTNGTYGTTRTSSGVLYGVEKSYAEYTSSPVQLFISKGTLENAITGKELDLKQLSTFDSTKTQVLKNINGTLTWVDES